MKVRCKVLVKEENHITGEVDRYEFYTTPEVENLRELIYAACREMHCKCTGRLYDMSGEKRHVGWRFAGKVKYDDGTVFDATYEVLVERHSRKYSPVMSMASIKGGANGADS